ncbi:MAG TPA: RnfABCDGE type electron transport complex subunit B [Gammaproteobacteria bacterium]
MLTGTTILAGLAIALAVALIAVARLLSPPPDSVADRIEGVLPRVQCAQCGYPGCRAYAEAIADGAAPINRCPPGGDGTIQRLAELLGCDPSPLDPKLGQANLDQVARIDETLCIGCNLCARACPVDAIAGISQMMHTVIARYCTGCELCLAPCPVDCITLEARDA